MADIELNPNQMKMLDFLMDTTQATPKDIAAEFPMASKEVAQEKENYADYLALHQAKLIGSEKTGEWITNEGILAYSMQNMRNPTHVH